MVEDIVDQVVTEEDLEKEPDTAEYLTIDEAAKNLEIEASFNKKVLPDGTKLVKDLKKEANRQRAAKAAEMLEEQALDINHVPDLPSVREEIELAESFEIIEE